MGLSARVTSACRMLSLPVGMDERTAELSFRMAAHRAQLTLKGSVSRPSGRIMFITNLSPMISLHSTAEVIEYTVCNILIAKVLADLNAHQGPIFKRANNHAQHMHARVTPGNRVSCCLAGPQLMATYKTYLEGKAGVQHHGLDGGERP